jgi:hypothetical protein
MVQVKPLNWLLFYLVFAGSDAGRIDFQRLPGSAKAVVVGLDKILWLKKSVFTHSALVLSFWLTLFVITLFVMARDLVGR